jgi:hypothetical protein
MVGAISLLICKKGLNNSASVVGVEFRSQGGNTAVWKERVEN